MNRRERHSLRPRSLCVSLVLAALGLASAGCDEVSEVNAVLGKLEIRKEGSEEALTELDLGAAPIGVPIEVGLVGFNGGVRAVKVCVSSAACETPTRVEPDDAPFGLRFGAGEGGHWTVASGDARGFDLRFQAARPGTFGAELVFVHDGQGGETRVMVKAEAVAPDVVLEPEVLDFGDVTVGRQGRRTLKLANRSRFAQPVSVASPEAAGLRFGVLDAAEGAIMLGEALETQIPAQGELEVQVFFQPDEELTFTSTLAVGWCSGPDCSRPVPMTGRGVKPAFVLEPAEVDFGDIAEEAEVRRTLTVRNLSDVYAVTVERVELPGVNPWFELVYAEPPPYQLAPGEAWPIEVVYRGIEPAEHEARVEVFTDAWDDDATDYDESRAEAVLLGRTMGPNIAVLPARVVFGTVPIAASPAYRTLVIQNVGTLSLQLSELAFNPTTAEMSLPDGLPSMPRSLPPGDTLELRIAYRPEDAGEDRGDVIIVSDDRDEPRVVAGVFGVGGVPTTCSLAVAPSLVTFGLVERGRVATLPVELRNAGAMPCNLTELRLSGAGEISLAVPPANPLRIEPGARARVDIVYAPTDYGQHEAQLEAQTDDPSQAMLSVPVRGVSDQSDLRVIPSTVDFGVVPVRCSSPGRRVVLYNTGASAVQINQLSLDPATTSEMSVDVAPGLPLRLGGGDSAELELRYRPIDIGTDTGLFFVHHNSASVPTAVPLLGEGRVDPTVTDTFSQLPSAQADVLFVVDNSGSMSEEQSSLGNNLNAFLQFAQSAGIDYHIGVVTTDVTNSRDGGRFRGSPRIIETSTPDVENVFRSTVSLGTSGSASERGLEAAYLALSDPLINTHNAGFLRQDAALAVIFVSDEPDHSNRTVPFYENFLRNLKGFSNPSMLSVSAVVGTTNPRCEGPGGRASYAPRYIEIANNTGGVVESICSANWGRTLGNIALSSFGLRAQFTLSSAPVGATLRIRVDGVDVPGTDASGNQRWSFDGNGNTVTFQPGYIPPEGASIEVTYAVACL